MKYKFFFTIGIILFFITSCKNEVKTSAEIDCSAGANALTFNYGGQDRQYLLYIPANLPSNAPLVFVLHGYSQNAKLFYNIGFNPIADTAKFAVCYPQGINCAWDVNSHNSSDVNFLKSLAQYLQNQHSLNPSKTFATGFSMGGALSNLLALDAGNIFKAAAPVAGYIYQSNWLAKNPHDTIPFFAIHGTADQVVNINGSSEGPPTQDIVNYWKTLNNCTTSDTVQFTTNTTAYHYRNGTNGNEVWFYKINGQDHVFPGDPNVDAETDVSGFNACQEIWKFFRKY